MKKDPNRYPPGWSQDRVHKLLDHYENQSDEEAAAEIEAAYEEAATIIEVPNELVPKVRELIEEHERSATRE